MKTRFVFTLAITLGLFIVSCHAQVDLINDEFPEAKQEVMETFGAIAQSIKDKDLCSVCFLMTIDLMIDSDIIPEDDILKGKIMMSPTLSNKKILMIISQFFIITVFIFSCSSDTDNVNIIEVDDPVETDENDSNSNDNLPQYADIDFSQTHETVERRANHRFR